MDSQNFQNYFSMKKRIEKLIPDAIKVVGDKLKNKDNKIPSEYNGYISSFGASIIQSGLVPAVAFYANENSKSDQDKYKLLEAIKELMKIDTSLLKYVCDNNNQKTKEYIMDIATALKLAIRTYELEKDKPKNNKT